MIVMAAFIEAACWAALSALQENNQTLLFAGKTSRDVFKSLQAASTFLAPHCGAFYYQTLKRKLKNIFCRGQGRFVGEAAVFYLPKEEWRRESECASRV